MTELNQWIATEDLPFISADHKRWLLSSFQRFDGYPTLEQLWTLMDEQWQFFGCDAMCLDEKVASFYSHPVWLLNGLFTEQHQLSMDNRRAFTRWVATQNPKRVADYGGGFGVLSRLIGAACPEAQVDIIEPHPHPLAIARASNTDNVRYRDSLEPGYDVVVATDVFEHVPDPLALAAMTAESLRPGGRYLIANCFEPVIHCHLPQTFHFRHTFGDAMSAIGLTPAEIVEYGRVFVRSGDKQLDLVRGRALEARSRKLWRLTRYLPNRVGRILTRVLL